MRMRRSRLVLVAAVATATTFSFAGPALAHGDDHGGGHGDFDIQEAVEAAEPGDTVWIPSGTYHQNVTVDEDDIALRGDGDVVLKPPDTPEPTGCDEGPDRVSGICVIGEVTFPADPEGEIVFGEPVRGVSVRGITVEGFTGDGLIGLNTEDLRVRKSAFTDNGGYGAATFTSVRTTFRGNVAAGNAEAGFYIGDSPDAQADVRGNHSVDNELGFFFRNASHGEAAYNTAEGNCFGVLLLADAPGPATHWDVHDNEVVANNRECKPVVDPETGQEAIPALSGAGVVLSGAQDVHVHDNVVRDNDSRYDSQIKGGIVAVAAFGPTQPSGLVEDNEVRGNQPYDLVAGGTVHFVDNRCDTSDPEGLCD
jgi:nitrous oxidase accessory protein NosD